MSKLFQKFKIYFLVIFLWGIFAPAVLAQEATTSPQPRFKLTPFKNQEKIKELKEKVATKVAQMRIKTPRAFAGKIKSLEENFFVLTKRRGDQKVLILEEAKFFRLGKGERTAISFSDLKVGERVVAFGTFDRESEEFSAKIIFAHLFPKNLNGRVTEVNLAEGILTVQNRKAGTFIIDIEVTTKIFIWEKDKGMVKSGFSKIEVGDRVHINATQILKEENRLSANRILVLPPKNQDLLGTSTTPSPNNLPPTEASPTP